MRALVLFLFIQNSTFGVGLKLELSYDYGLRHYEVTANDKVIKVKTPGVRLSLEKEKCNERLFYSFIKRHNDFLGKFPHFRVEKPSKKEFKKIIYQINANTDVHYMAMPQSKIGQFLLKLPEHFVVTKRQAMLACKKEATSKARK